MLLDTAHDLLAPATHNSEIRAFIQTARQTEKVINRQTDRPDRQRDRHTDRKKSRQTDREIDRQ